jgi:hypothetical protein
MACKKTQSKSGNHKIQLEGDFPGFQAGFNTTVSQFPFLDNLSVTDSTTHS